jgi:hypothetical protein
VINQEALAETMGVLTNPGSSGIALVYAANRMKALCDAIETEAIAELAFGDGWESTNDLSYYWDVGPKLVRVGADGTPLVNETLPLEIAAARRNSVGSATWLIRDIVNLKVRHPMTWQTIQEGEVPFWQAQRVAQLCS